MRQFHSRTSARTILAAGLVLTLAGCSSGSGISDYLWGDRDSSSSASAAGFSGNAVAPDLGGGNSSEPIAKTYNEGLDAVQSGSYRTAVKKFSEVEKEHPYSQWATKALVMQSYAQYMRNNYDEAINAGERFLTLHPGHQDAPYVQYLIALCHYERIGDIKRDPTAARKALAALEEVARRYPGTTYAADAERKSTLARDNLAGKEMEVGRYYQRKKSYLAAINRYKTVVQNFQTSSHTPEALYRLTENYMALGIRSEAQTAAAVLGHNYPNSQWYKDAYSLLQTGGLAPQANPGSWISQLFTSG